MNPARIDQPCLWNRLRRLKCYLKKGGLEYLKIFIKETRALCLKYIMHPQRINVRDVIFYTNVDDVTL